MTRKEKPKIDVTSAQPALKHSPFATLAGASAPQAPAGPAGQDRPAPPPNKAPPVQRLILRRETKHRGGKTVVIVSGFAALPAISEDALVELLQLLKQRLGCGGTVADRELLLQGDRPAQVAALLRERGFRVDGVTE